MALPKGAVSYSKIVIKNPKLGTTTTYQGSSKNSSSGSYQSTSSAGSNPITVEPYDAQGTGKIFIEPISATDASKGVRNVTPQIEQQGYYYQQSEGNTAPLRQNVVSFSPALNATNFIGPVADIGIDVIALGAQISVLDQWPSGSTIFIHAHNPNKPPTIPPNMVNVASPARLLFEFNFFLTLCVSSRFFSIALMLLELCSASIFTCVSIS